MRDIVERLREYASDDHERLCKGREYSCSCGYDDKRDPMLEDAADRIAQLEETNEMMLTDIRRTDVDMLAFKARIEKLEREQRLIVEERDRTFAAMLVRAEKAEADNERLRAALEHIADERLASSDMPNYMRGIARAALEVKA